MTPLPIQTILEKIASHQHPDGAFPGSSETIFGSVLTASILGELREYPLANEISGKILKYAQTQEHSDGAYCYWEHGTNAYIGTPYPPDLDDTANVLSAKILCKSFTGENISSFIKLLTQSETTEGGPYTTWLINDPSWNDVDLGVNANIGYALRLLDVTLPNLEQLFEDAIENGSYTSKYYHLPLMLLFFISRAYRGSKSVKAIQDIRDLQHEDKTWGTPTETALALCALSNFGIDITVYSAAISMIADASTYSVADSLYIERITQDETVAYRNEAVSLSLIALALHRYMQPDIQSQITTPNDTLISIQKRYFQTCAVSSYFEDLGKKYSTAILQEPISQSAVLLPYHLHAMMRLQLSELFLERIATAQLFGMVGYTLIDSILDGESDRALLPFALFNIRQFSAEYEKLFPENTFFQKVMDSTDQAFSQEYEERLKNREDGFSLDSIATRTPISWQKSYGYSLPFFAMAPDHHEQITHFFQSYLHAKQLHDDAHDLIEDLKRGHVTVVGKIVLEQYRKNNPEKTHYFFPINEQELRHIFWDSCFPIVYAEIHESIETAAKTLQHLPLFDRSFFDRLLTKIRNAQEHAAIERARMISFLKTY